MGTRKVQTMGNGAYDVQAILKEVASSRADRRGLLKQAAGLGLALPALGILGIRGAGAEEGGHGEGEQAAAAPAPPVQPFAVYSPVLAPVQAGDKDIEVVAKDATLYVANDVPYNAWTFDGTIPGRALRVVEGDTVNFTLKIDPAAVTGHSIDFHSAKTAPDRDYRTIYPGEELSFSFVAKHPGAYMYHCGTPPVLMHIGAGMYGAMIVDPKEGWSPAQELVLVQSDLYLKDDEAGSGVKVADYSRMVGNGNMDHCVFNGHASQYVDNPITVKAGEPVRMFVVNAGPNAWSSFHVVGTIFDKAYVNAHPKNELVGLQSITIGPGDAAAVEFTLDEPGVYPAVNHAFGHAAHGAVALLQAE